MKREQNLDAEKQNFKSTKCLRVLSAKWTRLQKLLAHLSSVDPGPLVLFIVVAPDQALFCLPAGKRGMKIDKWCSTKHASD